MRKILLMVGLFVLLATPAFATDVNVNVDIDVLSTFDIDVSHMNDVVIDEWSDFGTYYPLGYTLYDVESNDDWQMDGYWANIDFPSGWDIEEADTLAGTYTSLGDSTTPTVRENAANGDFDDHYWYFRLTGPTTTSEPGSYDATITLTLDLD